MEFTETPKYHVTNMLSNGVSVVIDCNKHALTNHIVKVQINIILQCGCSRASSYVMCIYINLSKYTCDN